jgi:glutathione S-transferase
MPKLKLTYFDAPGRAEPVRVALSIAGIPFEDHRVPFPEFAALKQSGALPLGSVPVLEVDGVAFTQTGAMLRYVAHLAGGDLYPADPQRALIVDSALDTFNDTLSNALVPSLFARDPEKKLAMRAAWKEGPMRLAFTYAEGLLERFGGPFLGGQALSIADLVVAQQIAMIDGGRLDGVAPEDLAPYPRLRALAAATAEDARCVAYRAAKG